MALELKLETFEGPLDLLLHLIEKNKVSIVDIPIAEITDQYMDYLEKMREANLDVMSEFLVMAATLLEIKSRMLLPKEKTEEGEEIDPRDDLVRQLLEYKTYKFMSRKLREREKEAGGVWYRGADIPKEVARYRPKRDADKILSDADVTLQGLYRIFQDVMKRREDLKDPIRSEFGRIEKEEFDTKQTVSYVQNYIFRRRRCTFRSLLTLREGKMYAVVTFLTILELMKLGRVHVEQEETFGEISIEALNPSEWETGADAESDILDWESDGLNDTADAGEQDPAVRGSAE